MDGNITVEGEAVAAKAYDCWRLTPKTDDVPRIVFRDQERSARAVDREREADLKKGQRKKTPKARRQIKRTTIQTMPYESFVSNYVMLNRSNVKVGKETCNLYSKTYLVPDVNYMSLTKDQQAGCLRADRAGH